MDEFEKKLKDNIKEIIKLKFLNTFKIECQTNIIENNNYLNDLLAIFNGIFNIYLKEKFGNYDGNEERIDEEIDKFDEEFSEDRILEFLKKYKFTNQEIKYVFLCYIESKWHENYQYDASRIAIIEIIVRAKILEYFGDNGQVILQRIIEENKEQLLKYDKNMTYFFQLFSDNPFGEKIDERFEEILEKKVNERFNDRINCGGYALKIDRCVFPDNSQNFAQKVTRILEEFPFTRLLGDTQLEDDEYLVIYRSKNGESEGHHFIRVDSDGIVREKNAIEPVQVFKGWDKRYLYEDVCEAVFAVKKDHVMIGYESNYSEGVERYDFEDKVSMTIQDTKTSFKYHGHEFFIKSLKNGEIIIVSKDGQVIADVLAEDGECVVEVREDKKSFVENFSGKIKPIIENGKLVNYDEFVSKKNIRDAL